MVDAREIMAIILLPPKWGYWSTTQARNRGLGLGLGLGTVSMHLVSPWNRPFVSLLLIGQLRMLGLEG